MVWTRVHTIKDAFKISILTCLTVIFVCITKDKQRGQQIFTDTNLPLWEQNIDFETANIRNDTGTSDGSYIVPNYVHFIRFNEGNMTYTEMIMVLAVLKNQKPDKIFFHHNINSSFTGKYWETLIGMKCFTDILVLNYIDEPYEIFGQPFSEDVRTYHASDVTRIRILMKYGGIYLDGDTYVVKNLNKFRRYEMTLSWDEDEYLGSQLLLAHKDARFLKLWLESYRGAYRGDLWYYNTGERPTTTILWKRPELVHRVKVQFGINTNLIVDILQSQWDGWKNMYAVHVLIRHQYLCENLTDKATFPVEFDENNIAYYPITFREMAYEVYDFANLSWPKCYKYFFTVFSYCV